MLIGDMLPKAERQRLSPPFARPRRTEKKAPTTRSRGGSGSEGQRGRGLPFWCKRCQGGRASGVRRVDGAREARDAGKKLGFLGLPKLALVLGLLGYRKLGLVWLRLGLFVTNG
ncbi:hypothetical protein ERO13_A04G133000v2 [Gossypium hirsutum]|nr:hypothetical protein ERO13_A04G133000v2 [Gossypium hirsutum]